MLHTLSGHGKSTDSTGLTNQIRQKTTSQTQRQTFNNHNSSKNINTNRQTNNFATTAKSEIFKKFNFYKNTKSDDQLDTKVVSEVGIETKDTYDTQSAPNGFKNV